MVAFVRTIFLLAWLAASTGGCLRISDLDDPNAAPAAPTAAQDVLDRHIEALGGEASLRKIEQRTVEARMVFHPEEGCPEDDETCVTTEYTGTFLLQNTADGHLYRRTVVGETVQENGFDGKLGWQLPGDGTLVVDTPEEAKVSREDAFLHWYFEPGKRDVQTELLQPRRDETTQLDGIRWNGPGGESKEMWFDRATGLLREEIATKGEGEQQARQVIVYEDYRELDGVRVPYNVRVTNAFGKRSQLLEIITQRVDHEKIDASKFAIPQLVAPAPKPDPFEAALTQARSAATEEPKDSSVQIEWARAAFAAARFDEARQAANATLKLDTKEPEALYILSRIAVLEGDESTARRLLKRLKSTGVRPEVIARELGWIDFRRRKYDEFAARLDESGSSVMAGRYRSFAGKPLQTSIAGNACEVSVALTGNAPLGVVDALFGDKKVSAIIDTGAADVILTDSFASELEVTIQARTPSGEGAPEIGHGQVPKLQIGGLTLENVPVNVFDDAAIADMAGDAAKTVRAVIGLSTLSDFQVTLDAPGGKLVLVPASRKCRKQLQAHRVGAQVPFWLHETHYLYVRGKLGDAEGVYLVNTGMRGADMTATQLAYSVAGIGAPVLRSNEPPMIKLPQFSIGTGFSSQDVTSAFGYFEQTRTSDGFRLDGMLGLGLLGRAAFTIDFEQQKLYFPSSAQTG